MSSKAKQERVKGRITGIFRITRAWLLVLVIITALFASVQVAEAAGNATQLIVFTDKKVYIDWLFNQGGHNSASPPTTEGLYDQDLVFYIYAIVLDDDGNIMMGRSGSLSGNIDTENRLDHYDKGDDTIHHAASASTLFDATLTFVDDGSVTGDTSGDGIYTAVSNPTDPDTSYGEDHLLLNITVTDSTVGTEYTYAFVNGVRCNGVGGSHDAQHTGGGTGTDNCAACHPGYEHFFENISGTIPDSKLDIHFGRMNPPNVTIDDKGFGDWVWNLSYTATTKIPGIEWGSMIPGSRYCPACHITPDNLAEYDYGKSRGDFADRPSCNQGVKNVYGETVTCHTSTEMKNSQIPLWNPAGATTTDFQNYDIYKAKSHNHTSTPTGVPCALCHSTPHGMTMPNMSADISSDGNLNDQCNICHDISNGFLNITSNGGEEVKHENPNCEACHYDDMGKLDAHTVPVGQFGGANCTSCHDAGSPNPYHIDISVMNSSDYIHYNLNNGSDIGPSPRWENRMCWACHSNDSVGADDVVDYSELPPDEHPEGYLTDHDCAYCHINTVGGGEHFGAEPNVEHNWYPDQSGDDNIFTPGIDACEDCHANPNMLNNSFQDTDFGEGMSNRSNATAENASKAAHYNQKQTWLRDILHGTEPSDYCRYCHQNMSTFAPYSNPKNKARSEHAPKDTTPSCTESLCHGEFSLHDEGLTEPHIDEGNATVSYCTTAGCHNTGYDWHNNTLSCTDCHIGNLSEVDVGGRIHPIHYINFKGGYMTAKEGAALCKTCHVDNNVTYEEMFGVSIPTVLGQTHSENPANGSIWNESWGNRLHHPNDKFWDYIPTYESIVNFTQSTFTSGTWYNITGGTGAEKLDMVNRTWGYEESEYTPSVNNEPDAETYTSNQNFDNGSFNWTSTVDAAPGGTLTNQQVFSDGNPLGYIYTKYDEGGGGVSTGIGTWKAWFNFNGDNSPSQFMNVSLSFDLRSNADDANGNSNIYEFILEKPDSSTVTLYSETVSDVSSWTSRQMYLASDNFTQNGNYSISIKSQLPGKVSGIEMDYDNVELTINKYGNYQYNATFVVPDVEYTETLQLIFSYQVNIEPANLSIYNSSTGDFEFRQELNKTADEYLHLILTDDEWNSGTVMFRLEDTIRGVDNIQDNTDLPYIFVISDTGYLQPCEYCHYPNKHFSQAVGAPVYFKGDNQVVQGMGGTWCASCHYDKYVNGSATYDDMITDFNETQGFVVPPEISGNETWGNYTGTSVESKYRDHEAEGWISQSDYTDQTCTNCHSQGEYYTEIKDFMHNVKTGTSGGMNCSACHDIDGDQKNVNFTAVGMGMHGNLNSGATASGGNASNKACWACHGTIIGEYANQSDQPESGHNSTYYNNPRECKDCHNDTSPLFGATAVTDHIPSGISGSTDVNTSSYNNTNCGYCHNNSIVPNFDPDGLGKTGGSAEDASSSHYGANKTDDMLMDAGSNSTDCVYCHITNSNMLKWGILPGSLSNISNKDGTGGTGFNHNPYTQSSECYTCHGGTVDTFHESAMSPGEKGNPDCESCHNISGGYAEVDFTAINNSVHGSLNSGATFSAGNESNKPCWGCHGTKTGAYANESDQPVNDHDNTYKSSPRKCEDCHINGSVLFNAPGLTEHIMPGQNDSTEINVIDGYCTVCHNNSITLNNDNDGMGILSAINASTAHYAMDANTYLMTGTQHSDNCTYCHYINNESAEWLTPRKPLTSTHTSFSNSTPPSTCWGCHVDSQGEPATFHVQEINKGAGSGPDCRNCHNTSDSDAGRGHIDGAVFDNSIHGNMNTTAGVDSNEPCWACHGNGENEGHNETGDGVGKGMFRNPYNCTDCHTSTGVRYSWASARGALVVEEHFTGGADIGASYNAITSYSCLQCHQDLGEMRLSNSDPDNNKTEWASGGDTYNATIGGSNSPYHYGRKRTDMRSGINTSCVYCHQNSSTVFPLSATNNSVFEHTSSGTKNTTGPDCTDSNCHATGYIHNSSLTKPDVNGWSGATNSVCAPCHETSGSGSLMKVASHNTTTTGITDCSECHNSENPGASGGYQGVHSGNLTNGTGASYDSCTECHTDVGTIFVTDAIKTHYKGASTGKADTTTYECEQCHNLDIGTSMHTAGMTIPTEGCNECHNDTGSTIYDSTILVPNLNHDNSSYGSVVTCDTCHDTASEPAQFHFTDYPNGTVQNTSWKSPDVLVNCIDCHSNNSEVNPYSAEPTSYHDGTYGDNLDDCYDCHTTAATANDANAPEAMHNVTVSNVWDYCTDCHASTAKNGAPVMDNTQIGAGIHKGLNGGGNDACTACHGTSDNHYSTAKNCDYCHMNGSDIYNSLQIAEHYPSASNLPTYPAQGDNESCITCHNMTEMVLTYTDNSSGTGYAIVSHYGKNRTDLRAMSSDDYCNYCHSNSTSVFSFDNATNKAINEHTTNTSADLNDGSMSCESCHGTGRIHNSTLTTPSVTEWTTSAADYCAPCHMPEDAGATKYVYQQGHDPNYSQSDRIRDCGFCHNSSSQGVNGTNLRVHSEELINGTATPAYQTCKGCHNGTDIFTGTGKQVFSHIPNASEYRGNTTTSGYTCEYCHNMSGKPSMHSAGMDLSDGDCNTCHSTRTSLFNSTQKIIQFGDYNHTYTGEASCNASQCHNASGEALGFHLDKYAAGMIADPERINSVWNDRNDAGNGFTDTPYVDCIDCHREHNDTTPFTNSPGYEANVTGEDKKTHTTSDSIDTCYNCHTNRTDATDRYMVHNVTIEPLEGGPACIKCHNESAPTTGGYPSINNRVNITAFNLSVHKNLVNSTAWNNSKTTGSVLLDSACWACHVSDINDVPANSHPDRGGPSAKRTYQCEECHTIGGNISNYNPQLYQNATKIYRHYAGKEFIGIIIFNSSKDCFECHRNSLITDTNISYGSYQYTEEANSSHYGERSNLIETDNNNFGCNEKCHTLGVSGGEFGGDYGNAIPLDADHNKMGTKGEACQKGCHNTNPLYNITLHDANMGINVGASACYSTGCHTAPSPDGDRWRRR